MATRPPSAKPSPRTKPPLLLIVFLAFLAALITFYLTHRTPPPADAPASTSQPAHANRTDEFLPPWKA